METLKPYEYLVKNDNANGEPSYLLSVAISLPDGKTIGTPSIETKPINNHYETFITIEILNQPNLPERVETSDIDLFPQENETEIVIVTVEQGIEKGRNKKRYSQATSDD